MRQDSLEGWEGHSEQGTACAKSSFGHDGFSAKGHSSCLSAPLSSPSNHLPFGPVRPGGDSHPGRSLALVGFVQLRPQLCKHPLLKLSPAVPSERVLRSPPGPRPTWLTALVHLHNHAKELAEHPHRALVSSHLIPNTAL